MTGYRGQAAKSNYARKRALVIAAVILWVVLYFPVIARLLKQWLNDPNYRHGILIPPIAAFFLWRTRESLSVTPGDRGTLSGLILIFLSALLLIGGTAASELFTARLSLPVFLMGTSLFLLGRNFTRKAAFPILLLLLMIPLPYIIYYKLTFPMQIMSARLGVALLKGFQVSVMRRGNIIMLPGYTLEVVAACSGLRSLMTMFTLSVVIAALAGLSMPRRIILVACSVPVAIAANSVRLVVTALGAYTIGPEFADGTLHEISGLIVFMAGLLLLMLCTGILRWKR